jgi:hypothetical protein
MGRRKAIPNITFWRVCMRTLDRSLVKHRGALGFQVRRLEKTVGVGGFYGSTSSQFVISHGVRLDV